VERLCVYGAPARTARISICTLGAFELAFDGRPVERWKAGKARNLLQFLLLRRGRVVSRDVLNESLWPDATWSRDSSSLKVAAHMLRNVLELRQGSRPGGIAPALRLLTRDPGYLLEVDGARVTVDFDVFLRLVDGANEAQLRGDRGAAEALYLQAAGLYRGDFLPDVPYDWAAGQREWLRSRLLCVFLFLTETNILRGDVVGVLRWCQRMLEIEPLHEETYRALILLHAHLGQLEQVQRWYRLCTIRMRENLQIAPDSDTQRLYARAVRGEFAGRPIEPGVWRRELQPLGYASLLQTPA
jgi:DNA-binding SARP family transcriptional activator